MGQHRRSWSGIGLRLPGNHARNRTAPASVQEGTLREDAMWRSSTRTAHHSVISVAICAAAVAFTTASCATTPDQVNPGGPKATSSTGDAAAGAAPIANGVPSVPSSQPAPAGKSGSVPPGGDITAPGPAQPPTGVASPSAIPPTTAPLPGDVIVTPTMNGRTVHVKVGGRVLAEGFPWPAHPWSNNPAVLAPGITPAVIRCGPPGMACIQPPFSFQARAKGTALIQAHRIMCGEARQCVPPDWTGFEVTVIVG